MGSNRDDFTSKTIDRMAKRVGYRCSNPNCRKLTCGAAQNPDAYVNIGVAAHICAAAPGGKRYDASMTVSQRKSILNGIWLCQSCAKLIDSDELRYSEELLHRWKYDAEAETARQLEHKAAEPPILRKVSDPPGGKTAHQNDRQFTAALNQEIGELLSIMETIYQKLDAAKQDENTFMTQAYEKRLEGLMMLYTNLNKQLKEMVSESRTEHTVALEARPKAVNPRKRRRIKGAVVFAVGIAAVLQGMVMHGVLAGLFSVLGIVAVVFGIDQVFCHESSITDICSNSGLDDDKSEIRVLNRVQTMRLTIDALEAEVGKLHLDRIGYERALAERNCTEKQE